MTSDTTAPSYWLNWRFLLCATWILIAMVCTALLIWRYEGTKNSKNRTSGETQEAAGCLYKGEAWGTCLKTIHPIWLLGYRIVAFCSMLALLLADSIIHSAGIFYYYTEWTFTLVTLYFGLATLLSLHGYLHYCHKVDHDKNCCVDSEEQGYYIAPKFGENADMASMTISLNQHDEDRRQTASTWEYTLQINFQMCAGAVALTDSVFWLVLYPFFTAKDFRLSFLVVCMHSVNAVFLLGETILNSLRFPFFRMAYFLLWTCVFVVFQWTIHAFVPMRWPYPFLELSSPYAPIWYLSVGLLHLPCFGIFTLIFKIKNCCLSR